MGRLDWGRLSEPAFPPPCSFSLGVSLFQPTNDRLEGVEAPTIFVVQTVEALPVADQDSWIASIDYGWKSPALEVGCDVL